MLKTSHFIGAMLLSFGLMACSAQPSSTPSKTLTGKAAYPAGDTLGAVHNLSPSGTLQAASLIKTGQIYSLGITTGPETPKYPGRNFAVEVFGGEPFGSLNLGGHDDAIRGHIGIGSQLDGLGHINRDGVHYGGLTAAEIFSPTGLKKLGTHHVPPMATRGLLLDMAALADKTQLSGGEVFNRAEIDAALARQNLTLRRGDVVLFHTGWLSMADEDPATFIGTQPGLGTEGAQYLAEAGVVAIGADTAALEALPAEVPSQGFPVHAILLVDHGVYILETINTHDLALDKAYEFMFVLGQPRIKGSVQAIINPVAIR